MCNDCLVALRGTPQLGETPSASKSVLVTVGVALAVFAAAVALLGGKNRK